jgi:hypothetical protein
MTRTRLTRSCATATIVVVLAMPHGVFAQVLETVVVNNTTRTETSIARRWAAVGTSTTVWIVWNKVVRDLARRFGLSGLDAARAYALLNAAEHDALLTSFNGKFLYGLWRPVTAIREAARDGNPATEPDPNWLPLLPATPPYPSCRGHIPLTVTWTGTGGAADITRSYNGLRHLADEATRSRGPRWHSLHLRSHSELRRLHAGSRLRREQLRASALLELPPEGGSHGRTKTLVASEAHAWLPKPTRGFRLQAEARKHGNTEQRR